MRVVIAGGGTGGHAFPALALAESLAAPARPGGPATVRLVGTRRGPEGPAAAAAGIPFEALDVAGFRRSLAPGAVARNVGAAAKAVAATGRAVAVLRAARADVAVGVGGYASAPVAVAAAITRTRLVLHEQNAVPGRANRLASRWAAGVALSFPGSEGSLRSWRRHATVRVTGNPIRPELAHLDRPALRPEAMEAFGLDPGRRTLLVFGGSQGARRINQAALGAYPAWRRDAGLQVLHLAGRRDLAAVEEQLGALAAPGDAVLWRRLGFTDRMDLAYAAADLAVCRAGAATLFEIAAAHLPAIVVPYPYAGDHQRRNAQPLLELEAIRVIPDPDCTADSLAQAVEALWAQPDTLAAMGERLGAFARPDATEALAGLVEEVAGR